MKGKVMNETLTLNGLNTTEIVEQLLLNPYYETVAWDFIAEAVETAKKEAHPTTLGQLHRYITENLI